MTTTGYATADFDLWPPLRRYLLLFLMFVGRCAGSTGGGIKCVRLLLLYKYVQLGLRKIIHPHAVICVKVGKQTISDAVLNGVVGMFVLFMGLFVFASLAMGAFGLDMVTSISSVAATLGNISSGLAAVGPTANYASLSSAG
jgi:trk system potassium uptake protein TrkH